MKFLVDECTGTTVATWLASQGYEVFSVFDSWRGATDDELLNKAVTENYIFVTMDSYFIKVYPKTHRNYAITEGDSADWLFTFSCTRRNKQDKRFQKGFIELTFNDYDNR